MNKKYAMDVLEAVERGTLESDCSLAKEAYNYLKKLKKTHQDVLDRIYRQQYK